MAVSQKDDEDGTEDATWRLATRAASRFRSEVGERGVDSCCGECCCCCWPRLSPAWSCVPTPRGPVAGKELSSVDHEAGYFVKQFNPSFAQIDSMLATKFEDVVPRKTEEEQAFYTTWEKDREKGKASMAALGA